MTTAKHYTWVDGEKPSAANWNQLLDFRSYATKVLADAAVVGWTTAEQARWIYCLDTHSWYYWNGTTLVLVPTTGGSSGTYANGTATVANNGTIAHGLGASPTTVILTANAVQPYALGYEKDATNITVHHNAAGTLAVSWWAVL